MICRMEFRKRNIVIILFLTISVAEEVEKTKNEVPQSWYREWVRSQENPYIQERIKELGKKISIERGWVSNTPPRGWFLKFLHEQVVGQLVWEARAAYNQETEKVEEKNLEVLVDDAGNYGMSTSDAITYIGIFIFCCFIFACCAIVACKK